MKIILFETMSHIIEFHRKIRLIYWLKLYFLAFIIPVAILSCLGKINLPKSQIFFLTFLFVFLKNIGSCGIDTIYLAEIGQLRLTGERYYPIFGVLLIIYFGSC